MKSFPSLHTHSQASILDGVPSPSDYFKRCDELEMEKIALTDHGSLGSLAEATIESKNFNVNPIMGLEGYLILSVDKLNKAREAGNDKDVLGKLRTAYHIILLAKNEIGYKNLLKINNFAWTDGFYYRPNFDYKFLFKHKEGLICSSACQSGIVSKLILNDQHKAAEKVAARMKKEFGTDFYLELQLIDMEVQDKLNKKLIQLGNHLKIPFTLTNDAHFVNKGDHEVQKILMEIASKGEFSYDAPENYIKSLKEWEEIRDERKSISKKIFYRAIENCIRISSECDYTVPLGNLYFPSYDHTTHFLYRKFQEKDKSKFFKKIVLYRAKKILKNKFSEDVYRKRLAYEYNTLVSLGAIDYFLICDDLLNFVRSKGAFSLIRGSANGSLIAFVFGFGLIDPIKHNIMFERFISKFRSLNDVDIDIDVRSEFRSKATAYLKKKYGKDRVVSVGTYNRMQLKGAVKDVTRVLKDRITKEMEEADEKEKAKLFKKQKNYQFSVINKITAPMEDGLTVSKARKQYQVFDAWCDKNQDILDKLIKPAVGTIRNVSIHPAGVVITPEKFDELLPVRTQTNPSNKSERVVSTVWENSHTSREDLNEIGLMILDILGVKTLSVVSEVIKMVKEKRGIDVNLYNLDLDDKEVLKAFNKGELVGVFQFSGGSASKIVSKVPITEFNDLIVINALARPGALSAGADAKFAKRKKNPKLVKYAHHSLGNILNDSLGVLVFSEHILRTASEFAGMHPKKADALRKIIKGKNLVAFKKYEKRFIAGAIKKWSGEKDINKIAKNVWKNFSQAGSYLFPRGHASSYALLGYICQYLKVKYPVEFFACHLRYAEQAKYSNIKSIAEKHYGVRFKMPNINTPKLQFEATGMAIDWPVTAIKNVGNKAAATIIENAPYSSVKDFYSRVNRRPCNSRVVESLIVTGAFKDFGKKKSVLLEYRSLKGKKEQEKDFPIAFRSKENMRVAMEDLFGFETVSYRKLYAKKLRKFGNISSFEKFTKAKEGSIVRIFGRVTRVSVIDSKNGKMAFASVKDGNDIFDITLFADAFKIVEEDFSKGDIVVVSGTKNVWEKKESIVISADRFRKDSLKSGSWIRRI